MLRMAQQVKGTMFNPVLQVRISPLIIPDDSPVSSPRKEKGSPRTGKAQEKGTDKKSRFFSILKDSMQLSPKSSTPKEFFSPRGRKSSLKDDLDEDCSPRTWKPLHPLPDISLESPNCLPDQKKLQECWRNLSYLPRPLAPIEEVDSC
jgi:hypothetical protein